MLPVVSSSRFVLKPVVEVVAKTSARDMGYYRVVSGPPRVRISFAEKVAHGIVLAVGCSIVPVYISQQIQHYNAKSTEEED